MTLGHFFVVVVLVSAITGITTGSLNNNVCSYTARRSFNNLDDPFRDEDDFLVRATKFRCCDGWTRADGNREGNTPCFIPICKQACGLKEVCYKPDTCLCVLGYEGCPSTTYNVTSGKKRSAVHQFNWAEKSDGKRKELRNHVVDQFNWVEKSDSERNKGNDHANQFNWAEKSDHMQTEKRRHLNNQFSHWVEKSKQFNWVEKSNHIQTEKRKDHADQFSYWAEKSKNTRKISKRSTSATCPVALPQHASSNCTSQRQVELATNRAIYKIRDTPDYDDPNRDLDTLITPLWDIDPPTAFGVGASDSFEAPWLNSYFVTLGTNGQLVQTYLTIGNNSVREFKSISDWRELFFFFYMFHVDQGNVPTNINDLVIDMWQDDRIFAEQQIAGLNPFPLKRVIGRPCPPGWTLIGENCYKMFYGYPYSNFKAAQHVCECHISHLADLSDSQEAVKVNRRFRFAPLPVYVDGANGTWPDGTPVVGASNQPDAFRRCLTARFTRFGLKLRYSYCFLPLRKIICQKSANIHGVKISTLKSVLNPTFKWRKAIRSKLASISPFYSNKFPDAVQDGRVYVSEFPELRGIRSSPDFEEVPNDGRIMLPLASPIAIFVSNPDVNNGEFLPVAIQVNSSQNSPVFTPADGDDWTIAKILVQTAAFTTAELLEHLLHTHIVNDPLCVSGKRNLPVIHPMGQLVRQHCRGTLTTNKVGELSLLPPGGRVDRLLTVGFRGQNDIINNGFNSWSFNKHDPNFRLKKQGLLDRQALPFHPYRDDGLELYKAIGDFIRDYVYLYYADDAAVVQDHEIQGWANEIALDATGTADSGKGKVRDFPKSFSSRAEVIDVLHKFVWSSSCQHAAMNFPVIEYGTFIPNMPGKFYNVENVTGFNPVRFATKTQSLTHIEVGFNLGALHFDSLFDYAANLADPNAVELVFEFKARIDTIQAKLVARNNANIANGHLSYKYLHPTNIPNSIST